MCLDLSANSIGPTGAEYVIEQGLKFNSSLRFLDLFDVDIASKCVPQICDSLQNNTTLVWLRMSNTHVSLKFVDFLWQFVKHHRSIRVFRWHNVEPLNVSVEDFESDYRDGLNKLMVMDIKKGKLRTKGVFVNPYIGDLALDLV